MEGGDERGRGREMIPGGFVHYCGYVCVRYAEMYI